MHHAGDVVVVAYVDHENLGPKLTYDGHKDKRGAATSLTQVRAQITIGHGRSIARLQPDIAPRFADAIAQVGSDAAKQASLPPLLGGLPRCAIVLVLDLADSCAYLTQVRDAVNFALKTAKLQPGDMVGIVDRHLLSGDWFVRAFTIAPTLPTSPVTSPQKDPSSNRRASLSSGAKVAILNSSADATSPLAGAPVAADFETIAEGISTAASGCGRLGATCSFVHLALVAHRWLLQRPDDVSRDILVISERAPAAAWAEMWAAFTSATTVQATEPGRAPGVSSSGKRRNSGAAETPLAPATRSGKAKVSNMTVSQQLSWPYNNARVYDEPTSSSSPTLRLMPRIHGCFIGAQAASVALQRMAFCTKGRFQHILVDKTSTEAVVVTQFRTFIAHTLASVKYRIGRAPVLKLEAGESGSVELLALHDLRQAPQLPVRPQAGETTPRTAQLLWSSRGDAGLLPSSVGTLQTTDGASPHATLLLPDICVDEHSEFGLTFSVPSDFVKCDVVRLAKVTFQFVDQSGAARCISFPLVNKAIRGYVDREVHRSLQQARLEQVVGTVALRVPGRPSAVAARGGETILENDSIELVPSPKPAEAKRDDDTTNQERPTVAVLRTPDGTVVEFTSLGEPPAAGSRTNAGQPAGQAPASSSSAGPSLFVERMSMRNPTYQLRSGYATVLTASNAWCTWLLGAQNQYSLRVFPKTLVRVRLSSDSGSGPQTCHVKCVSGECLLQFRTIASAQGGVPATTTECKLLAPKQVFVTLGEKPTAAIAIADDAPVLHAATSPLITDKLHSLVAVDTANLRFQAARLLGRFSLLLDRGLRTGTLAPTKAAGRCRCILLDRVVTEAKIAMAATLGAVLGGAAFHDVKRAIDDMTFVGSLHHPERRTWQALVGLLDSARSLLEMRACGTCRTFLTPLQHEHGMALMSAKERAAALQAMAEEAKRKQAMDAEERRRRTRLAHDLGRWDYEAKNAFSVSAIQTVLYGLQGRQHCPDWAPFFVTWEAFVAVFDRESYSLSADQLTATLASFASYMNFQQFNIFADAITEAVEWVASTADASRLSRALHAVYRRLDGDQTGRVLWKHVVQTAKHVASSADGQEVFFRIERATQRLLDELNARRTPAAVAPTDGGAHVLRPDGSQLIERESSMAAPVVATTAAAPPAEDATPIPEPTTTPILSAVTLDDLDHIPLTLPYFLISWPQYFTLPSNPTSEMATHQHLAKWHHYMTDVQRLPRGNIPFVVSRLRKEKEVEPLVQWDLPHVFDGITDRHVREFFNPAFMDPPKMNSLCAPICVLAGFSAKSNVAGDTELMSRGREDYVATIRGAVRSDVRQLFEFLKSFPVLSLSRRVAQHVSLWLSEPEFDASNLLKYSPVLSSLCSWCRVILRIAFLTHEWEVAPNVPDTILRQAIAERNAMTSLITNVTPLPADASPARVATVQERAPTHNVHFRKIFDAPPVVGWGESSPYPPVESPRVPLSLYSDSERALVRPGSATVGFVRTPSRPSSAAIGATTPRPSSSANRLPSAAAAGSSAPPPAAASPASSAGVPSSAKRFSFINALTEDDRIMSCVRHADEDALSYETLRRRQKQSQLPVDTSAPTAIASPLPPRAPPTARRL